MSIIIFIFEKNHKGVIIGISTLIVLMKTPINHFLKTKITKVENDEFKDLMPDFLLNDDSIMDEMKKIDKNDIVELFGGVFLALNQLGEKLFLVASNNTVNDDFKQKILNYNPKSDIALSKINDLIFSDIITSIEVEYKENGLTPFYNEKFDNKIRKLRHNNF